MPGIREGLGPCRSADDQADHNTDQSVPRHVPALQGTRHRPGAGRHARRLAFRPRHKGCGRLSARLPFGRLQASDRAVRRTVRPDNLPGRDLQHAGTYGQAVRRGSGADRRHRARQRGDRQRRDQRAREGQDALAMDVQLRHRRLSYDRATRGKCVPTDFLAGARPKVWLSDRLPAQCTHAEAHQFCLAHLIRDAQYAIDHGDTIFAPQFKAFLKDACAVGRRRPDLADSTIGTHRRRLDRELDRLLDLKPTDVEGSHLRATIVVTARDKLLVFLTRRDVEATNNASERALRPSVIFRRLTNGFRSEWGAKVYADLCSIVATGRLAGNSALAAIRDALAVPAPGRTAA